MTIKDIADKCGVSVSTVSRVMNNQPYVKEDVRQKVLAVIEEEGFVPHEAAAALARNSEEAVGVIVRGLRNAFFNEMINIVIKKLHENGYNPYLQQISSKEDELKAAISLAKSRHVKGIIFLGGQFDHNLDSFKRLDVPCVFTTFTNSFGNLPKESYSSVGIDDVMEAERAVDYLIKSGHKDIGIVLPACDDMSISQLRYRGYLQALEKNGIKLNNKLVIETHSYAMEDAYAAVTEYIKDMPKCTALFVISDALAMATMKAVHLSGRKVPEDCAIIGIDGLELSNYTIPTLTTLVQPREEMAAKSVEILQDMIENEGNFYHITLETHIRTGGTV